MLLILDTPLRPVLREDFLRPHPEKMVKKNSWNPLLIKKMKWPCQLQRDAFAAKFLMDLRPIGDCPLRLGPHGLGRIEPLGQLGIIQLHWQGPGQSCRRCPLADAWPPWPIPGRNSGQSAGWTAPVPISVVARLEFFAWHSSLLASEPPFFVKKASAYH